VIQTVRGDSAAAFGDRVVIAHRLDDRRMVYSVYAHLKPGSIRVRANDRVRAGQRIASVGRSGNATTPHLHLEVRVCGDPAERWERIESVDPLEFLQARLCTPRSGDGRRSGCMMWAEAGALVERGAAGDQALDRGRWWSMLAHAARHPLEAVPARADSLRRFLIAEEVLPARAGRDAGDPAGWEEIARDLERLERKGLRLPHCPLSPPALAATMRARFSGRTPGQRLARGHPSEPPTVLDAVLLLADLSGPEPAPRRRRG
jgi:hypothetical protein